MPKQDERVGAVDLLSFLCELAMLAALAVAGANVASGTAARVALGITLPVVAIAFWGVWLARNSSRRIPDPARLIVEMVLFAGVGALLGVAGYPWWGGAFAVIAIGSFAFISVRDREKRTETSS